MRVRFWLNWGIAARLLTIAILPAGVMFVAATASLYYTAQGDVRRDVAARGQLIATALAQSSQYGLVSGNVSYLRTTLRHLLEADASIACIVIADDQRKPFLSDCAPSKPTESDVFEVPVRIESLPEVDLFESVPGPHATDDDHRPPQAGPLRTIGYVRVTMSTAPIFESKRRALLAAAILVLAAAALSCLVGLWLTRRLRQIMASVMVALRAIRQGRFDVALSVDHQGELGELQRTIVQMASTLNVTRHELEQQVLARTQELQEAVDRVRQADAEKRRLIVHSNALVEEDRRRVALEIHDHLGASLISVRLEAAALVAKAEALGDADMARGAGRIAATTESLYSSTRHIVKSLRPEVIDTLGLSGALEEMVRSLDKVHPDCRFSFSADADVPELRGEAAMPAYRVTQEALANAVKHSGASRVTVNLQLSSEQDHLRIVIADNGQGFDTQQISRSGFGLLGMRERVAAVGGDLTIHSSPGKGTSVSVTLRIGSAQ